MLERSASGAAATPARSTTRGWWRPAIAAPLLVLLLYAATRPLRPAPPLGPLLDPVHGILASARGAGFRDELAARIPGLTDSVTVLYDARGVPHIFARSEVDAYRALGFVVARDRLFQLELQTRAAAGTLTELAGSVALPLDREMRALGLPRAAERKLAALDTADVGYKAMVAYGEGVNAWIDALEPSALPIEYHLLGARPARWAPINGIHLLNRMGYTLSFSDEEIRRLGARDMVSPEAFDAIYPFDNPIQEPIQPAGRTAPRYALRRLPPPGVPVSDPVSGGTAATSPVAPSASGPTPGEAVGSNNWAVAPSRSASGRALLAGDPHLDLTLPSIWYEAHLVVPGVLDVYGVTIPGAPTIIIGFNRDVAWTFTNTQADVVDYYAETVDDLAAPTRYMLDGQWTPLEIRVEQYLTAGGSVVSVDTMRYTHRGPMQRAPRGWVSMRWTLFEPSREMGNFIEATRARTVADWMEHMATYIAPAQNMLVADRSGAIAIRSTGVYPIRPGDGRGDVIRDGSKSASDWTGWWPVAGYPQAVNPPQGFLASANQQPIDPAVNPAYLGADWYAPWRALRINQLLRTDSVITPDAMRRYQTDPGSARADAFVPYFLAAARGAPASDTAARAAGLLAEWDRRYTTDNERAVLFEYAMRELGCSTWDELRVACVGRRGPVPQPNDVVLLELLQDSTNAWWDVRGTALVERRDAVVRGSLSRAFARAVREHGDPAGGGWRWAGIQQARIPHLLGLPAFAAPAVPVLGGPSTLNPTGGQFGASWRMVVELGDDVRGWAVYPGGQSGNPLSPRYLDRLDTWTKGELDTLIVPRDMQSLPRASLSGRLHLGPR